MLRYSSFPALKKGSTRYGIAVVAASLALGLRFLLAPLLGPTNPYHTVWLGVVFCAWFCGVGPSILATLLMVLGVWYWFLPPFGTFALDNPREFFGIAGFLFFACVVIAIGERARRTQARLNAAHDEMEAAVKQRTAELAEANERLRELSSRLLHMQDVERRRLARDLHDSVGQLLAVLGMNLASFDRENLSSGAARALAESKQLVEQISGQIRTISHLLHPPLLEEAGLKSALRIYVDGFSQRSQITASLEVAADLSRLSQDLEISIFRIVQECLTNIHKHAAAKRATIRVARASPVITLSVIDDGKGMPEAHVPGVGLTGMQERVRQLHGTFKIISGAGGTTIAVTFPAPGVSQAANAD